MALGLQTYRPAANGVTHVVSAGHHLAASAGYRILEQGGNAIDAGVASGLAINVVLPQYTSLGGVAPIMIHRADTNETVTISGLGRWPKAVSIDLYQTHFNGVMPRGLPRSVTPSALDAWVAALKLYGTMSFEQVATPALELARNGYPIPWSLHETITGRFDLLVKDMEEKSGWDSTTAVFCPNGRPVEPGEVLVQKDLARTFERLIEAERAAASQGREKALEAVRDLFYKGDIAQEMVRFCQEGGGFLTMEDLASFRVKVEPPAQGSYRGVDIYTCGPWCQGPVVIQALHILEGYDLVAMGLNSPDYIHTVVEALKLAFADRHAFYGDPEFVDVPMDGLLSKEYAAARRRLIDARRACPEMPQHGDPMRYRAAGSQRVSRPEMVSAGDDGDTSYTCVVDRWGNAFSATPSDTLPTSPIVPGLGFIISSRGSQGWLDPNHPSSVAPGKRPRLTPNPAMASKDGKLMMPFGTPGGDVQCQSMVQLVLNVVDHGMEAQQAVEAPRFSAWSFPNSFWPHAYRPGLVGIEGRIPSDAAHELERRGHKVEVWDDWTPRQGSLAAIIVDRQRGMLNGAADPRRDAYAIAR